MGIFEANSGPAVSFHSAALLPDTQWGAAAPQERWLRWTVKSSKLHLHQWSEIIGCEKNRFPA